MARSIQQYVDAYVPVEFRNRHRDDWVAWTNALLERMSGAAILPPQRESRGVVVRDEVWIDKPPMCRDVLALRMPDGAVMGTGAQPLGFSQAEVTNNRMDKLLQENSALRALLQQSEVNTVMEAAKVVPLEEEVARLNEKIPALMLDAEAAELRLKGVQVELGIVDADVALFKTEIETLKDQIVDRETAIGRLELEGHSAVDAEIIRGLRDDIVALERDVDGWEDVYNAASVEKSRLEQERRELVALYDELATERENAPKLYKMAWIVQGNGTILGTGFYPSEVSVIEWRRTINGMETTGGSAYAGMTVELTAKPADGWVLTSFTVQGVAVASPYHFVMPAKNVIVTAVFVGDGWANSVPETIDNAIVTDKGNRLRTARGYVIVRQERRGNGDDPDDYLGDDDRAGVTLTTSGGRGLITGGGYRIIRSSAKTRAMTTASGQKIVTVTGAVLTI